MIVEIEGVLAEKRAGYVVVRTNAGLGYGVEVPRETQALLGERGERVRLYTHLIVREDQWRLIGFATEAEKAVFLDLIEVNGVGVKGALSLMSYLGIGRLREVVLTGEWKELKGASGIGAKIAQRVQLELMGRWSRESQDNPVLRPSAIQEQALDEVVLALVSLGYGESEAQDALRQVTAEGAEERIRQALKSLDRRRTGSGR